METSSKKRPGIKSKKLIDPPNRCRELREAAGYILREFAEKIGVKPASLSRYETKGKGIGKITIYKAAEELQTDFATLDKKPP